MPPVDPDSIDTLVILEGDGSTEVEEIDGGDLTREELGRYSAEPEQLASAGNYFLRVTFTYSGVEIVDILRIYAAPARGEASGGAGSTTDLVEFVVTETEQNHRVISSVKKLPEIAGAPGKTLSISALRLKECQGKSQADAGCAAAVQQLNTSPKSPDGGSIPQQYDVMIAGGQVYGGLIPWTAKYNQGGGH